MQNIQNDMIDSWLYCFWSITCVENKIINQSLSDRIILVTRSDETG